MAGTINRIPPGLLGFLGLKTSGTNPRDFGGQVTPTWDLSPLYLADGYRFTRVGSTLVAAGSELLHGPPNGEIWVLDRWGLQIDSGIGDSATVYMGLAAEAGQAFVPLSAEVDIGASDSVALAFNSGPLILKPGQTVALGITRITVATGIVFGSHARYTALDI